MASVYLGSSRGKTGSGPTTTQIEPVLANTDQRQARELKKRQTTEDWVTKLGWHESFQEEVTSELSCNRLEQLS